MIKDEITGINLFPGQMGKKCPGNESNFQKREKEIYACCNECDYGMCCTKLTTIIDCIKCNDYECPNMLRRRKFIHKIKNFFFYFRFSSAR